MMVGGKESPFWLLGNHRILYDQDFLEAGCPAGEYVESTEVDDLFWTYSTNYWIAGVAIAAACALCSLLVGRGRVQNENEAAGAESLNPSRSDPSVVGLPTNLSTKYYIGLILYFMFAGLSYGIAGVGHQVVTENGSSKQDMYERLTALFLGISSWSWIAASALEYYHAIRNCDDFPPLVPYPALLIFVATIWVALIVIFNQLLLMGVTVLTSILVALTMSIWQYKKYHHLLFLSEIFSFAVFIAGLAVQSILSGACGDDGYEDCFKDCPLPDPSKFNHNALFHVLTCAYMIQFGLTKVIMMVKSTTPHSPTRKEQNAVTEQNADTEMTGQL